MVVLTSDDKQVYQRALECPFFYVDTGVSYLRLSGDTRIDFLQRQTTNDLRLLTRDRALLTVLTSPTARILDVLLLIDEQESVGVIPLPGRAAATAQFLASRIFFMDRVSIEDMSAGLTPLFLGGNACETILESLDVDHPLMLGETLTRQVGSGSIRCVRLDSLFLGDYLILADRDGWAVLAKLLEQEGVIELNTNVRQALRVERGHPESPHELGEDYTPLEAGLQDAIAQDKGCYTGQEILARQRTYDKVVQTLVGVKLDRPVAVGTPLIAGGRSVGIVTSSVESPRFGLIGLGYVRRPHDQEGTILQLNAETGGSAVVIHPLPFALK